MSPNQTPRFGWIGLGSMGLGMAKNLQTHLSTKGARGLRYYNRTMSRGEPLSKLGGVACDSMSDVVLQSVIIFISVSDDDVLRKVVDEILAVGNLEGRVVVDTTTVHPNTTREVAGKLGEKGAAFVAAPVFGASPLAESGQLLMAVAGPASAIETVSPYLKGVLARGFIQVGEDPSKAVLLKTTSNFITAGLMYLVSEAHVLADKSGLPAEVLESLIQENFGTMAYSDSQRMTQGIYLPAKDSAPYSDLALGIKDVKHGLSVAEENGVKLKVGEMVMEHMTRAKKYGEEKGRRMDSSSMFGVVRQDAGLEFETEGVKKRDAGKG